MTTERADRLAALRREPPRFREMAVSDVEVLTPRMARVAFTGPDLEGLTVEEPAASVRLLLPSPDGELVIPGWEGNEFLLPGGERPLIRTFTPVDVDPDAGELSLMIVLHEGGAVADWAASAGPGDPAAVSGPGRGYEIDPEAPAYFLAGDETAIAAIGQLMELLPPDADVSVHLEAVQPDARLALPEHPQAAVKWRVLPAGSPPGATLVAAVEDADLHPGVQVWAAGEAAAMQRIRKVLAGRGLPREQATVRGYWKRR